MSQQSMAALRRANTMRLARCQLKRDVKAGKIAVSEILLSDLPDWLTGMRLDDLLQAAPRIGKRTVGQLAALAEVNQTRRLRWVTPRQRRLLAETLDGGERKK